MNGFTEEVSLRISRNLTFSFVSKLDKGKTKHFTDSSKQFTDN